MYLAVLLFYHQYNIWMLYQVYKKSLIFHFYFWNGSLFSYCTYLWYHKLHVTRM